MQCVCVDFYQASHRSHMAFWGWSVFAAMLERYYNITGTVSEVAKIANMFYTPTEATSLDWKLSVFGKSQCSATAC
jgi:hypothetical protein